ncbi:regulator of chromosome condensation 1/beta-lactamase-inhibitor protein II [Thelephora terrestris]|uniref:Regulator of chromosome condensation 1/beta-lactamase-inhibitor protein II n=1 Tax=Thelephora terrestris TaxID=56493 RepID=A0A9P6HGW6_9AGAM|nr:regulator of chromosome condensation 1/beta-lactamase-inhibitor protein II [Thelephora terrestris]
MPFTLLAAGSNAFGQLGTGSLQDAHRFTPCVFGDYPPGTLPPNTQSILQLASGANHSLILLRRTGSDKPQNELWGAGDGSKGQLGPSRRNRALPSTSVFHPIDQVPDGYEITNIAAAWETSYIVFSQDGRDDILMSMGADDFGDLGVGGVKAQGSGKERLIHVVDLIAAIGSVARGTLKVAELVAGPHHIVARLDFVDLSGHVVQRLLGWGASRQGQLGVISRAVTSPVEIQLSQSWSRITQVSLGNQHTVFRHFDGSVTALGSNRRGQLNNISSLRAITAVQCTWNGTTAVASDDCTSLVSSSGTNEAGQLGHPCGEPGFAQVNLPLDDRLVGEIVCGSEHTLVVLKSIDGRDELWGWGWNEHGNLGTGDTSNVQTPIRLWPPVAGEGVADCDPIVSWAGCGTSWVLCTGKSSAFHVESAEDAPRGFCTPT